MRGAGGTKGCGRCRGVNLHSVAERPVLCTCFIFVATFSAADDGTPPNSQLKIDLS